MQETIGRQIKSYELEDLIGTGAFGAVYRARQALVGREVAVKIIWPAIANLPNFIRRFETEAQLVAGLEHPYIVPLYDYWRDPEGAYMVMRWLRGGHLRERMKGQAMPLAEVLHILNQVGAALAMAHRYGVVHRDIKPENILLDEEGNAYLADFGIAQILSVAQEGDDFAGMGSPAYAAPEQVNGGIVAAQSDLYSLGVLLYEMLTGTHPFPHLAQMSQTEMNEYRARARVPSLLLLRPDVPAAIDEVIQCATALSPNERYADASSFLQALQAASGQARAGQGALPRIAYQEEIPNPYRGLRPFTEMDALNFYGREALVHRLVMRLRESGPYSHFLAVVGPSGSGKSSVVKAGLIPALRRGAVRGSEAWFYDELVPGTQPFEELASTLIGLAANPPQNLLDRLRNDPFGLHEIVQEVLPDDGSELLLLIDQFEELFTQVRDEAEISRFLDALTTATTIKGRRLRVVITIRADFYDRPLLHPRFSNLVRERTEVVIPLTQPELERAIQEPLRRVGVSIESGLVATIIAEVKDQPASLPLLQYALSQLFEQREGALITARAYKQMGGVRGTLALRAEALYEELTPDEREATRQLCLRLITLGEGTEDTRRRALLNEILPLREDAKLTNDQVAMRRVIDKLSQARLIVFDRDPATRTPTLEVTHEAIIREWKRLRLWLDESRADLRMERALAALAQEWDQAGREASFLLRGIRLDTYEKWAQTTTIALTAMEREFLEVSAAERRQREAAERERMERERRLEQQSVQRLRLLVLVLVLAMAGAFVLTGLAVNASNEASASARISRSLALEASARDAASEGDNDLALLLALLANEMEEPPVQSRATLNEVSYAHGTRRVLSGHSAWVTDVALSPDRTLLASSSTDGTVRLWDAESGAELHVLTGHHGDVETVAFSPDGRTLLSGAADFAVIHWDAASGAEIRRLIGHTLPVRRVVFTPDGTQAISASSDTTLILWDLATGEALRRYEGHAASVLALALSPDGRTLLSGARDGSLLVWNLEASAPLARLEGHSSAVTNLVFSRDGRQAASSSSDGEILIWEIPEGMLKLRLPRRTAGEVRALRFSPDGQRLYAGGADGVIQIWDVTNGLPLQRLRGHSDAVLGMDLDLMGEILATASKDTTLRLWNIGPEGLERAIAINGLRVTALQVGADGVIYAAAVDGRVRAYEMQSGAQRWTSVPHATPLLALALLDGEHLLASGRDGTLLRLQRSSGETEILPARASTAINALVALPDGRRALGGTQEGEVLLWDLTTGEALRRFAGHQGAVNALALLPDGASFLSAGRDTKIIRWDLSSGQVLRRYEGHESAVYSLAINPNGTTFASAGRDRSILVWDMSSGVLLARLNSDADAIWTLAFSPDGERLMSGGTGGLVQLWEVTSSGLLARYTAGTSTIFVAGFSADGRYAISGHENGALNIWRALPTAEVLTWARDNRYVRQPTCQERARFRIEPLCVD